MAMVQTQTVRGFGRSGKVTAQTAVECRFSQEVQTVLSSYAQASITSAEAGNGEIRYRGKVYFSLVYENAEKHVCREEKGVEFTATARDERVFPAMTLQASVVVEDISVRREGASVYLTALLGTDILLYSDWELSYVTGGELVCKREQCTLLNAHPVSGTTETSDEFTCEQIGDILLHAEKVTVTEVLCSGGYVKAEGEINVDLLALKEEAVVSFERLIPFSVEIPCEQAEAGCNAELNAAVDRALLHVDADAETGCKITAEITVSLSGCVYEEISLDAVTDAFSVEREVTLDFRSLEMTGVGDGYHATERVSGKSLLSGTVDFSDTLQAVTLQRAEANLIAEGEEYRAEGVAVATLLLCGADGSHRGVEMSLPFSVPLKAEGNCQIKAIACGMSARQRQEGEIEAEATIKLYCTVERSVTVKVVSSVEEGEAIKTSDSAVSVYVPKAGDGLWELSKRLRKSPEEVSSSNPDLEFPIGAGKRVVIYRKKEF